jgi:hypothetical protein
MLYGDKEFDLKAEIVMYTALYAFRITPQNKYNYIFFMTKIIN